MQPVGRALLSALKRVPCFFALVLCYDLILRLSSIFLTLLLLPGAVFYQQVLPAMLSFCKALMPGVDVMVNHMFPALVFFLVCLSLPVSLFLCLKLLLLPFYFKLFQLVF